MNLRLTKSERIIAWRIALGGACSTADLVWHLWGGDNEPGDGDNGVKQIVFRIRTKLKPFGVSIKTRWRLGYVTTTRDLMLDVLAREVEANCFASAYVSRAQETRGVTHVSA